MAGTDLDDTVYIGYGGSLVAMTQGKTWGARTPSELIAKLDAEGIDRKRLCLIVPNDISCPDHALGPKEAAAFVEILGDDART